VSLEKPQTGDDPTSRFRKRLRELTHIASREMVRSIAAAIGAGIVTGIIWWLQHR
jgi:hypothetical protein